MHNIWSHLLDFNSDTPEPLLVGYQRMHWRNQLDVNKLMPEHLVSRRWISLLDPVVIYNSVYRKGLSDLFLLFLVLFFLTHFHSCRGYSHCYPAFSCYSVTHFHYHRCCISCYPVLLLYLVAYFHSCHCYAHRYPVLPLLYPVTHFYSCLYCMHCYTVLLLPQLC